MNKIVLAVLFLFFTGLSAAFAEAPPNWPWKAMTMSFEGNSKEKFTVPEDIALLKKRLGINSVRLTLDVRLYAKRYNVSPDEAWARNLEWAEAMLDACKAANVTAVLSISQFPVDPALGFIQDSPEYWNDPAQLEETLRLVRLMAGHFKGRGAELGAYEVLNEPLLREGKSVKVPPQWPAMMNDIVSNIRAIDPTRWIVLTPGAGGLPAGYKDFRPLNAERIVYGAHEYVPHQFTHQGIGGRPLGYRYPGQVGLKYWDKKALQSSLAPLRSFQKKHSAYIWIGEFSAARWADGAEQYLADLVCIFDSYGWGWAYFNYGGYHGWNPDYDTGYSSDVRSDWTKHYVGEGSVRWNTLKKLCGAM